MKKSHFQHIRLFSENHTSLEIIESKIYYLKIYIMLTNGTKKVKPRYLTTVLYTGWAKKTDCI